MSHMTIATIWVLHFVQSAGLITWLHMCINFVIILTTFPLSHLPPFPITPFPSLTPTTHSHKDCWAKGITKHGSTITTSINIMSAGKKSSCFFCFFVLFFLILISILQDNDCWRCCSIGFSIFYLLGAITTAINTASTGKAVRCEYALFFLVLFSFLFSILQDNECSYLEPSLPPLTQWVPGKKHGVVFFFIFFIDFYSTEQWLPTAASSTYSAPSLPPLTQRAPRKKAWCCFCFFKIFFLLISILQNDNHPF